VCSLECVLLLLSLIEELSPSCLDVVLVLEVVVLLLAACDAYDQDDDEHDAGRGHDHHEPGRHTAPAAAARAARQAARRAARCARRTAHSAICGS